jgi:hypothetical protein
MIDVDTCSAAVDISVAVPATVWIDADDCSIAAAVVVTNDDNPFMLPANPSIDAAISFEADSVSSVAVRIDSASAAVSSSELETVVSSVAAWSMARSCSPAPSHTSSAVFAMLFAEAETCSA